MTVARMAQVVRLERRGESYSMTIDGEEFPYFVAEDIIVPVSNGGWPGVQVTILADRVEVVNDGKGP